MSGKGLQVAEAMGWKIPDQPLLKKIWYISISMQLMLLIVIFVHISIMDSRWSLWKELGLMWTVQLFIAIEAMHISGFADVKIANTQRLVTFLLWGIALLAIAFYYVAREITDCNSHSKEIRRTTRECYRTQDVQFAPKAGDLCLLSADISSAASGVCPYALFGETAGAIWSAWQLMLVMGFLVSDVYLMILRPGLVKMAEKMDEELESVRIPNQETSVKISTTTMGRIAPHITRPINRNPSKLSM
jgi:hypothetical protein